MTKHAIPLFLLFVSISTHAQGNSPVPTCNGNQNDIYDPRVPPAGVYTTRGGNGSSTTVYSTGDTKPYYVENNCGNQPPPQPEVLVQPNDPISTTGTTGSSAKIGR